MYRLKRNSGYGYGELNQILSGTAFSYIDKSMIISGVIHGEPILKKFLGKIWDPPIVFLREGFQQIFQNLIAQMKNETTHLPLQVLLNTKVHTINSVQNGVLIHLKETQLKARAAYVTSVWQRIVMPGINAEVRDLFQNLIYQDYGTTVFKSKEPMDYLAIDIPQSKELNPLICLTKFPWEDSRHIGIAYTKGSTKQSNEICSNLKSYLDNNEVATDGFFPLAQKQVEYHPRFKPEKIKNGAYRTIDMYQGTGNIFFGGAILSFDLTEPIAVFSKQMSKRIGNFLKK
jgi:hypothetical protein